MNYTKSKQILDEIRSKYNCTGDVIFRTAIQYVVECGQITFRDEAWFEDQLNAIDDRHDSAEATGKILFCTRDFEKAIFNCAKRLAYIDTYDLLTYISREVYLGGDGIDYQRAMELLKQCMDIVYDRCEADCRYTLGLFEDMGFYDDEIEQLGFGYLFEEEEEE